MKTEIGTEVAHVTRDSGRERSLTISSVVWLQCPNVTDGRTDRQTPGDSKDRVYA